MTREDLERALQKYIPQEACSLIAQWVMEMNVHLKVTRSRNSKLGDYRAPFQNKGHRITVNHNLNPYAFLVTLVHELAHLQTWNKYQFRVSPHGAEWKVEYKKLMQPFLTARIFPDDVHHALLHYMADPAAASCSHPGLSRALAKHDNEPTILLEELAEGTLFALDNGMQMKKGTKQRTRYRCLEMRSGKTYLVSGQASVQLL